ncbi:MAG: tautomerase family protein [Planctomycetaceae bacterium]|nr:tautomerase family protein [Planctomycetaceae bacterium]
MPHVIVKLWPGKSEKQKEQLAERITQDVMEVFHYGEESISVSIEEVNASAWREQVLEPDILAKPNQLYKKPGYSIHDL